jgi:hypothetical protein
VEDGVSLLVWEKDSFAYADSWDEEAERYRGLKVKENITVSVNSDAVIVKPEAALELRRESIVDARQARAAFESGRQIDSGGALTRHSSEVKAGACGRRIGRCRGYIPIG